MRRGAYLLVSTIAAMSCTQILGIDGRYVVRSTADSGKGPLASGGAQEAGAETGGDIGLGGSGATPGSGGIVASGGMPLGSGGSGGRGAGGEGNGGVAGATGRESGGTMASGGTASDADVPCPTGQKRCPAIGCVSPDPSVGCDPNGACAKCDFPSDSQPTCNGTHCDFECHTGFTRNSATGTCDPSTSGAGGAGGTSGLPGSKCTKQTPTSSSSECRGCPFPFPACCNGLLHCGCLYVAACF